MNKKMMMIAGGVVVIIILLAGGYLVMGSKGGEQANTSAPQTAENKDAISSIADALSKSMSLKCEYSTPEGIKTVAYIKNGMVRSDVTGATPQQSGSAIIRDKKMYFWNENSAFTMTIPDVSVTPSQGQDSMTGAQSTLAALEQYKSYCKNSSVSDSLFELPAGVKFQDMSNVMQGGMQQKTPSGSAAQPSGVSQEQIQEMMKKYQAPQE